ncbi:MAG: trypsin-like peptidase domain-containing protein [Chloroflexota bacterium]|nr:trypsin-like peptidase domain-containing protein [Chloroflexota bacterium]
MNLIIGPVKTLVVILSMCIALVACGVNDDVGAMLEQMPEDGLVDIGDAPESSLAPLTALIPDPTMDAESIVAAHERVFIGVYTDVVPSIVQIRTSRKIDSQLDVPFMLEADPEDLFQRSGGSGFVWDESGHIVTNHHVVTDADRVIVMFSDGSENEAQILGSDPDSDLAVLKIDDANTHLFPVTLGSSSEVSVGQIAIAIGSPFGQDFSITSGIVSAVGRTIRSGNSQFSIPKVLQTDAPINPGNSGGPLLDRKGRVVGVNTQIISNTGASSGIGFAVPIDAAKRVIPELIQTGSYKYSWLGISGTSLSPDILELIALPEDTTGALIIEVMPDGPAYRGGLIPGDITTTVEGMDYRLGGDIIVSVDGTDIKDMDHLISYLIENTKALDVINVAVLRDGVEQILQIELGERP